MDFWGTLLSDQRNITYDAYFYKNNLLYLEIKFGSTTYKTDVYRKSLNPQWNTEWYRFEVSYDYSSLTGFPKMYFGDSESELK